MSSEPASTAAPPHEAYTVKERVAVGTAGVVYRGMQAGTEREVTFKVLSPKATHPMETPRVLALRWRLEALKHPVIAELLDAYDDPEGFVIVSSWLGGGLGGNEFPRKCRNLTKEEARLVAMRLCGALLIGEQQRFPHGDLKPSNVILADRGQHGLEVQVQDWGLSACREIQPPETLQFMAPERHHGHPASVQGDLFSAGATLWFLLTGEPPVYGSTSAEVLQDWGSFDAAALAQLRPDLDDHFRQWTTWLLRWQPGDRPQSVSQALDVLNQVVGYAAAVEAQAATAQQAAATAAAPPPQPATPAKPAGPRAAAPRLQLPVASSAPPPSSPAKKKEKPAGEKASAGQRAMVAVMLGCLIAGIGVAFAAWAEERYGHDWKQKLTAHWRGMFATKPVAATAPVPPPSRTPAPPKAAVTVKSGSTPKAPFAKPAAPSVPKSTAKAAPPKPLAVDRLDGNGDLNGRTGGTGWKGPWQATLVSLEKNEAVIGKGLGSTATRALGTLKNLPDDYFAVSLKVTHPGQGAAPLKLDVLSPDGRTLIAPACVAFADGKVQVFIEGAPEKLEAPAGTPFRLLVRWNWKAKKSGGKREVVVTASVNPPTDPAKTASIPLSKRTLAEHALPANFMLLLRSEGATQPATVSDIRVGHYLRDALP